MANFLGLWAAFSLGQLPTGQMPGSGCGQLKWVWIMKNANVEFKFNSRRYNTFYCMFDSANMLMRKTPFLLRRYKSQQILDPIPTATLSPES